MHFNRSRSRIANVTLVFCHICSLQTPERDPETTRLAHKGGHLNLARSGHLNLAATTCLRVTGLMLPPSLGAAWLAWQIGPPVGFGAEPSAVAGPPSQRAAPPAWRPLRPSLELRTSGPLPARSPVNEIGTYPPVHSRLDCAGGPRAPSGSSLWDCSGAVRSRCDRIFAMSCGSSMLAMIFSSPPQRVQL